ncbi:MAG: pitrilysin family protein, partial [Vicingaceae bacterium]
MKKIFISALSIVFATTAIAQVDRSKMPEPGPAPKIELGKTESFTLDNGLKVFVVENHKLPKVAYSLSLNLEGIQEGDKAGTADIAGDMLAKGTENRTKEEINFGVDYIGARLNTYSMGAFGTSLTKHQETLLDIMSDVVKNAKFNEEELEKLRKQYNSNLQTEINDPDAISGKVRRALLYGKDHPYGEVVTEETLENITLEDVQNYYGTYFRPNISYLAVVGDVTVKEVKPLVEKYFGDWEKGEVPSQEFEDPKQPQITQVAFVNRPGAVQSVISVFNTIELMPGSEDDIPASIANGILGGGFISKLNLNLREENAYTYGARSSINSDKLVGNFYATAKVRNEVTDSALTEMLNELMAMRKGEITKDELNTIKNYRTGTFAYSLENPQTKARFAINKDKYNLPDDYYETYLEKIAAVTLDKVKEVSKKYVNPMKGYILVVGNQEEVAEKVKKFSPSGNITFYDPFGNEVEETSLKPAPEGVTVETVINKYIDAIGGKKNIEKVKSLKMLMSMNIQGFGDINMNSYYGENGELLIEQKTPRGNSKQIFDGEKAQVISPQGSKMLEGEELESFKYESVIFPELDFFTDNYEVTLKGVDNKADQEVYAVEVVKANGDEQMNY